MPRSRGSSPGTITRCRTTTRTTASQFLDPPEVFLERRAAAYRAYYEHMPLPDSMRPRGQDMRIYTRAGYGALAALHVLDDRQYRSHQVCPREGRGGSNVVPAEACPELQDPSRTLLGAAQERWLDEGLAGVAGALERDRPADHDGAARPQARRGTVVLDRRLGRLPESARAAALHDRRASAWRTRS